MRNICLPIFWGQAKSCRFRIIMHPSLIRLSYFRPGARAEPQRLDGLKFDTQAFSDPIQVQRGENLGRGAVAECAGGSRRMAPPLSAQSHRHLLLGHRECPHGDALPARLVPSFRQDPAMRGSAGFPGCRPGPRSGARRPGNVILARGNTSGTRGASLWIHGEAAARTVNC